MEVNEHILFWSLIGVIVYLILPWTISLSIKVHSEPAVERIDWDNFPLPNSVRQRVQRDGEDLQGLGYVPVCAYLVRLLKGNQFTVYFVFANLETQTSAVVLASLIKFGNSHLMTEMFTAVSSVFQYRDLPVLQTRNQDPVIKLGLRTQDVVHWFPHVTKVGQLITLHERLETRHFPDVKKEVKSQSETADEYLQELATQYRELIEDWVGTGVLLRPANHTDCRFPAISVFKLCWGQWLPLGPILKLMRIQQAKRLERELVATAD